MGETQLIGRRAACFLFFHLLSCTCVILVVSCLSVHGSDNCGNRTPHCFGSNLIALTFLNSDQFYSLFIKLVIEITGFAKRSCVTTIVAHDEVRAKVLPFITALIAATSTFILVAHIYLTRLTLDLKCNVFCVHTTDA
jgi:hypothetical protein